MCKGGGILYPVYKVLNPHDHDIKFDSFVDENTSSCVTIVDIMA